MNLRAFDLNLLIALDALLATGSVTRAAREVGITQPAMSNALARLRAVLKDPVLVRQGRTFAPTPRALALRPILERSLRDIEAALMPGDTFRPARARAILRIALSDYWQIALLPRLVERLEAGAPGVRLHATATAESVLAEDLPRARVDAAIFLSPRSYPGLHCETFVTDGYACVTRVDHPASQAAFTLERYASFGQVVVTPRGPWEELLSEALHRRGLEPQFALLTAHTQVALDIVARTDYVAILPRQIARQARSSRPVTVLPPPVPVGEFSLGVYWHKSTDNDPLHRWFRGLLINEARAVYYGPGD